MLGKHRAMNRTEVRPFFFLGVAVIPCGDDPSSIMSPLRLGTARPYTVARGGTDKS